MIKKNRKNQLSDAIQNKIKIIKIFTKRLMKSTLSGDYLSAFKGSGLEFDQLRDYHMGDDIRFIDWNSSAKMNKIMIKQLIEERDRTVILAIDVSSSSNFSSKQELRKEMIAQVAASLTFIASNNKDRVGALFFSDQVEKWIPPSHGNAHVGRIIETIFEIKPKRTTNINEALKFLVKLKKRNSIIFMLSDWIEEIDNYSKILKVAGCEYDFVGIRFLDDREKDLPDVGLLDIQDLESGKTLTINTKISLRPTDYVKTTTIKKAFDFAKASTNTSAHTTKKGQMNLNAFLNARLIEQKKLFEKYRIDLLDLNIGQSFINPMINFFRQRIRRQI